MKILVGRVIIVMISLNKICSFYGFFVSWQAPIYSML